jgi:uncharacterized damage-inducible protein DinB
VPDQVAAEAIRALLRDAFSRVREQVAQLCDEATSAQLTYRVDPNANTIAWLIWHLTRIEDDHVCGLTGKAQVWTKDGWYERFGLPFDRRSFGYGMSTEEVGEVKVAPELLDGYHRAVHEEVLAYVDSLTPEELDEVVDTRWDPPVTAGVRLVSVIGDCQAHLGQAEYVHGIAERAEARS